MQADDETVVRPQRTTTTARAPRAVTVARAPRAVTALRAPRIVAVLLALVVLTASACSRPAFAARPAPLTPLQAWMHSPMQIAHRGGDADWPEATAYAYANAAAWNPALALEVPVWRTADGVWVVSEDRDTGRVFGTEEQIGTSTWAQLSTLRTLSGHHPMARLVQDVIRAYPNRVLFVDDKAGTHAGEFLDLLDAAGGPSRIVVKSYWTNTVVPAAARQRGYGVWGYYDAGGLASLSTTQQKFTMLGLAWFAPASAYQQAVATGKPVIGHVVSSRSQAAIARSRGARGLMVSGVQQVVDRGGANGG